MRTVRVLMSTARRRTVNTIRSPIGGQWHYEMVQLAAVILPHSYTQYGSISFLLSLWFAVCLSVALCMVLYVSPSDWLFFSVCLYFNLSACFHFSVYLFLLIFL